MTNKGLKSCKNGFFYNFLFWKKKKNRSQNKGTCQCRKTNQLTKSFDTVQDTLNLNNKDEEKFPALKVNTYGNHKDAQGVECPGKLFQSKRRGCGLHVYFCIDNMSKSNYPRNKQIKNRGKVDCFEGGRLDQNTAKEMIYYDNEEIKLAKSVKSDHSFSSNQSIKNKTQRKINFKRDNGELTSDTYNYKGMLSSSPQTAVYTLENFHVNYSDEKKDIKQTNLFHSNITSSLKEKSEISSAKISTCDNLQKKTTEENEKEEQFDNEMEIYNATKLNESCIHHSKEIPEIIIPSNNVCEESVATNQARCIEPLVKPINSSNEHRSLNFEKGPPEQNKISNISCMISGSKEGSYLNKCETDQKSQSLKGSILRKKENETIFVLENGILVRKIPHEPTTAIHRVQITPPNYIKDETELTSVNQKILNDPDEMEIFGEYERFQSGVKSKRKSTMKTVKSSIKSIFGERQYLDIYLPEIMSKINNIEDKLTELEKVCEDKGKSGTNIKTTVDISYNNEKHTMPDELKNLGKSNYQNSLKTYSKEKSNKTIKIETSNEEIFLNTPKTVSITKKNRNREGSKQLVYHNTYELDAHNIATKPLSKSRKCEYKNSKTIQQHTQTTQVADLKGHVFGDKWRRISEELKIEH